MKNTEVPEPENSTGSAEAGVLILNTSLVVMALDQGAAAILRRAGQVIGASDVTIPQEMLKILRRRNGADHSPVREYIRIGGQRYTCRIHAIESFSPAFASAAFAIHFERGSTDCDPLLNAAEEYHLTGREFETLQGVSSGLTSKEMADQMCISPNTVKSFLHLVMVKMGVSSRAAIVAKVLEHNRGVRRPSGAPDHGTRGRRPEPE